MQGYCNRSKLGQFPSELNNFWLEEASVVILSLGGSGGAPLRLSEVLAMVSLDVAGSTGKTV